MIEKFLHQPVSPFNVSQHFGEDRVCISNEDNKTLLPKETSATCPAGYRSLYALTGGHNGLDLRAARWEPIYASHTGIVTEVETEPSRGLGVGITSTEVRYFDEAKAKSVYKTRYWHLIALDVHLGDKLKVGDLIGYADSTGYSTGDHLHFELKPVTIIAFENGVPVTKNLLQNNGHQGAINPLPYMSTASAKAFGGILNSLARLADLIADFLRNR